MYFSIITDLKKSATPIFINVLLLRDNVAVDCYEKMSQS